MSQHNRIALSNDSASLLDKVIAQLDTKTVILLAAFGGSNGLWATREPAPSIPVAQYTAVVVELTNEKAAAMQEAEAARATCKKQRHGSR